MSYGPYISKITLPNGTTYDIKDQEARDLIAAIQAGGLTFTVATNAANTPLGVIWDNEGVEVEGTLVASLDTKPYIVLVPHAKDATTHKVDYYREYVTVDFGTEGSPSFAWEYLGNTDIDLNILGDLAYKDSASGNVTFSTADSATFSNGSVSASATYTPAGSISTPTITVTPATTSVSVKDEDGSVSAGSAASFTRGSFSGGSFTQGTDSFTAPVLTAEVATGTETLSISFNAGSFTQGSDSFTPASHGADTFTPNTPTSVTLPTFKSQTVATGITSASSTQPTFTGTEATISSSGTATGDVTLTKTDKTKTVTVR